LADDVFVQFGNDFPRSGNLGEKLFCRAAATLLLIENRLAEFDAFPADVNISGSFNERSDLSIALATKRTMSVLLGSPRAATARVIVTCGHDHS
jgi:hypothetical protein